MYVYLFVYVSMCVFLMVAPCRAGVFSGPMTVREMPSGVLNS